LLILIFLVPLVHLRCFGNTLSILLARHLFVRLLPLVSLQVVCSIIYWDMTILISWTNFLVSFLFRLYSICIIIIIIIIIIIKYHSLFLTLSSLFCLSFICIFMYCRVDVVNGPSLLFQHFNTRNMSLWTLYNFNNFYTIIAVVNTCDLLLSPLLVCSFVICYLM
jgi:hypothetical protein